MSRRDDFRSLVTRSREVVLASAIVGAITGVAVAGFERLSVDVVFDHGVAHLPLWLLAFAPGIGLAIAALWLRYPGGGLSSGSADEYLQAFHERRGLSVRDMLHRIVAAVATLGSGSAMGLEGPSIYLGATIGSALQRRGRSFFAGADPNLLLVAGAAAGIAAVFKAPATGAIFAIEVPFQEDLARRMLLPALVAAATGYLSLAAINGTAPLFPVHGSRAAFTFVDLAGAAVLGLAAGLGARLFASLIRRAKHMSGLGHPIARVAVCGATIAALFAIGRGLTGQSLVLAPGYGVVTWALAPHRAVALLLAVLVLRCLATGSAVAAGGVGGLFVPLVVAGALLGRAFGAAVGSTDSLFLVIGIAAFLGAGYRVPLAAVVFVAETTGRPGFVVPGLIAAVIAELVMSRMSVTAYQTHPAPGMADDDEAPTD